MLLNPAWGQTVVGSDYNDPSAGPPGSYFAAATTMPVAALVSAVAKASKVPQSAAYLINNNGNSPTATIHADFASLSTVCSARSRITLNNRQRIKKKNSQAAAYVFVADMDVDCDGIDYTCKVSDRRSIRHRGILISYQGKW